MNRMLTGIALAFLLVLASVATSRCDPIHPVDLGFQKLRSGPDRAMRQWAIGGRLEHDRGMSDRIESLRALAAPLGRYEGREDVCTSDVGGGSVLIYSSARFQRGTIFFRFTVFQDVLRSYINAISWSDDPADIFPEQLIHGRR